MTPLKWRQLLAIAVFFLCLALPFSADSREQTRADAAPAASAQQTPAEKPGTPPPSAQAQPTAPPETPKAPPAEVQVARSGAAYESATVLRVTTRLVMLDVVARDSHGHAVLDLEPKDFTVSEDATPQKVRPFGFQ